MIMKNIDASSHEALSPAIRRLAFNQGWSDELVAHALKAHPDEGLEEFALTLQKAADCLNLSVLRNEAQIGNEARIGDEGARLLGFDDLQNMQSFEMAHPLLSIQLGAIASLEEVQGVVIDCSETEVIVEAKDGLLYYGARLPESPQLHELARIRHGETLPLSSEPVRRMRA